MGAKAGRGKCREAIFGAKKGQITRIRRQETLQSPEVCTGDGCVATVSGARAVTAARGGGIGGQYPKATKQSCPHSSQRARANPLGQDAALKVGTQLALGVGRDTLIFPVVVAPVFRPGHNPAMDHRLVKDYKLVRDSPSEPVADARLAARVFREQWEELSRRAAPRRAPTS